MKETGKKWDIDAAEKFFTDRKLPKTMTLSKQEKILDVKACIESHIATCRANNGTRAYRPYWDRLKAIKAKLQRKKNGKDKTT